MIFWFAFIASIIVGAFMLIVKASQLVSLDANEQFTETRIGGIKSRVSMPESGSVPNRDMQPINSRPVASNAPQLKESLSHKSYEAILGEQNRVYYLMKFARFDQYPDGLPSSWNWSAFLFSWAWAIYRKMYGTAFVLFVAWMLAVGVEVASQLQAISGGIMLIVKAVFAVYANVLYHRSIKQKIRDVQALTDNELKQFEYLKSIGGVNVVGAVLALVVWGGVVSVLQNLVLR